MFRTAEVGRKVTKDAFAALEPQLRIDMLETQRALRDADFPVIILFAGVDGAGKSESINLLNEWMDPRWITTNAYGPPADVELERPEFWRFWRDLPANGTIGLFLSSWYSAPVLDRAHGRIDQTAMDARLARVSAFERALADDGALILKFWMHLGKDAQKKRLKALEKDPLESWRVTKTDWKNWDMYDAFIGAAERTIHQTSVGHAPWHIVEGADDRYRSLQVLTTVRDAARQHMEARALARKVAVRLRNERAEEVSGSETPTNDSEATPTTAPIALPTVLSTLDMAKTLDRKEYGSGLKEARARLATAFRAAKARGTSAIVVMEGWDAAGKGGAVRRMVQALDARDYRVVPIAAPTDEEKAHHYLWRFWRHLPRAGRLLVFDRSWYGRVLVERVEGFADVEAWRRAYAEINDFEEQLIDDGHVLVKFWIHITKDEQLERFKSREATPHKAWKLTDEDWRNRDKWDAYEEAVNDMVERTSTSVAPWTLVAGNDKRTARVAVVDTVAARLEATLNIEKK